MAVSLGDFEGRWRTRRVIRHDDGTVARAEGSAAFTPDGVGLAYREAGLLQIAGTAPIPYERCYLWRAQGDGIAVLFDDGRFFHRFTADAPEALHDCPPDTYRVAYVLDLPQGWISRWRVDGKRKAYAMETRYRR